MQANAASFDFHQISGINADDSLTGTQNGSNGKIEWFGAVGDSGANFTAPNSDANTAGEIALNPNNDVFSTIAWGLDATRGDVALDPLLKTGSASTARSGLYVDGYSGTISSADTTRAWGDWVAISEISHQNQAIASESEFLLDAIIRSNLYLSADGVNVTFSDLISDVSIDFNETLNSGACPAGNPNGSICDDTFGFTVSTFAPLSFWLDGSTYFLEFGLGNFVDSATDFPFCGPICTVWTAENVTSSLNVLMRMKEVPEPATLLLLAAGLLGAGATMRRKQS